MATDAARKDGALAIEDYALIGDLHTTALVGIDGSIDWLCLPDVDSPACFAALIGTDDNGSWRIAPQGGQRCTRRRYRDHSMILETEWETDTGTVRVTDFMPLRAKHPNLVRTVEGLHGKVTMEAVARFAFDYGHLVPWLRSPDGHAAAVAGPDLVMLRTDGEMSIEDGAITSTFTVAKGESVSFVMTWRPSHEDEPGPTDPVEALAHTKKFWRGWIEQNAYDGPYFDAVRRSLLVLKSLTYAPTGGIAAAPTAGLPEEIGGERNWDYRFCWLRDATFTLQALLGCGYRTEAADWRHWLMRAAAGSPAELQPMYTIFGARRMPEWTVPWLDGYEGSTPVRIGNEAAGQFQLDVWGEVLGSMARAREHGIEDGDPTWAMQVALLDHLTECWREPDDGLWEMRGERRHFVHSKVLAWVGFKVMADAASERGEDEHAQQWQAIADEIHDEVCTKGFDEKRNTFTQYYGSTQLDAATLLLGKYGFLPGDDPRLVGTLDAVQADLGVDGFVRRYSTDSGEDGQSGTEGTFLACSFWLVEAMVGAGRLDDARQTFERLLEARNDVGLLAEEWDAKAGRQLGNFPQAYSHVGLVNAALAIRDATQS